MLCWIPNGLEIILLLRLDQWETCRQVPSFSVSWIIVLIVVHYWVNVHYQEDRHLLIIAVTEVFTSEVPGVILSSSIISLFPAAIEDPSKSNSHSNTNSKCWFGHESMDHNVTYGDSWLLFCSGLGCCHDHCQTHEGNHLRQHIPLMTWAHWKPDAWNKLVYPCTNATSIFWVPLYM